MRPIVPIITQAADRVKAFLCITIRFLHRYSYRSRPVFLLLFSVQKRCLFPRMKADLISATGVSRFRKPDRNGCFIKAIEPACIFMYNWANLSFNQLKKQKEAEQ